METTLPSLGVQPDSTVVLIAEKWVNGGYTISHSLDKPSFVAGALPGETVRCVLLKQTETHSFYQTKEVLKPSLDRIPSDCEYFGDCGGCSYRHISYENELRLKAKLLAQLLNRDEATIRLISEKPEGYRNNAQFHLSDDKIGFYAKNSRTVLDLLQKDCKNLPSELQVSKILQQSESKKYVQNAQKKGIKDISIRLQSDGSAVVSTEKDSILTVLGKSLRIPSGGFSQINRFLIDPWLNAILDQLPDNSDGMDVVELFCGAGTISISVANKVKSLVGLESFPKAIPYARKNAKYHKQNHLQFEVFDLYRNDLPKVLYAKKDLWILNPPRKGLTQKITSPLLNIRPKTILYSSCDPQTLARDIAQLTRGGYELKDCLLVDFFPRTAHYEVLVKLETYEIS